jgi:hypothetical protein
VSDEPTAARQVREVLRGLAALARIRNAAALADLPEPERQTWLAFRQEGEGRLRGPVPTR